MLVDDAVTGYEYGFVGFWLPEDITGTIEVSSGAGRASQQLSTTEGSPTCLTTMRLVRAAGP